MRSIRKMMQYFFATMSVMLTASPVFAQAAGAPAGNQWVPLAAGLGMAIAAAGCGIGQGKAAGSAAEALARNPGVRPALFTFMLIGLAFIESLALFTFLIILMKVK